MASIKEVDLTSRQFRADPYSRYARWRAESPVFRTTLVDGQHAWIVTRYDDVLTVLKDERFAKDKTKAFLRSNSPGCRGRRRFSSRSNRTCSTSTGPTTPDYEDWSIRRSRRG